MLGSEKIVAQISNPQMDEVSDVDAIEIIDETAVSVDVHVTYGATVSDCGVSGITLCAYHFLEGTENPDYERIVQGKVKTKVFLLFLFLFLF